MEHQKAARAALNRPRHGTLLAIILTILLSAYEPADGADNAKDDNGTDAYGAYILCANYLIDEQVRKHSESHEEAIRIALNGCSDVREAYIPYLIQGIEKEIGRSLNKDDKAYVVRKFDADVKAELLEAVAVVYGDDQ